MKTSMDQMMEKALREMKERPPKYYVRPAADYEKQVANLSDSDLRRLAHAVASEGARRFFEG